MGNFIVTPSPHITSNHKTSTIMRDVIIALMPALVAAVVVFGVRALLVTAVCVTFCVLFEYLIRRVMKRDTTISDLSAVVTGILLAYNLPVTIPLWVAVIGSFIAIVVVKQMFGGIGQNFANPALTARIVLFASFAVHMTTWANPFNIDTISSATPLLDIEHADTLALFLGNVPGCLGETSALALLLGGIYLVLRKVISPVIPLTYLGTVFVLSWLLGSDPVNQLFAGGLMLGAIFMATDYATTPITTKGKFIFALGCGLMTIAIRLYGDEGKNGVALHIQTVGYAGKSSPIEALIGFDQEGAVTGIVIVSCSETPGLGTRIEDPEYLKNYTGVSGSADGVDTITGATISSTALKAGVSFALEQFETVKGEVFA